MMSPPGSRPRRLERRTLVESKSPSLRDIGTVLMKVSQNLYAETLVKAIGAARGGLGTFEGGLTGVRSVAGLVGHARPMAT